jgi:hypothetical protein
MGMYDLKLANTSEKPPMRRTLSRVSLSLAIAFAATTAFAGPAWRVENSGVTTELRGLSVVSENCAQSTASTGR